MVPNDPKRPAHFSPLTFVSTPVQTSAVTIYGTTVISNVTAPITVRAALELSEYAAHDSKRTINKALRKKRDAQKASQNARGRKWWEHR